MTITDYFKQLCLSGKDPKWPNIYAKFNYHGSEKGSYFTMYDPTNQITISDHQLPLAGVDGIEPLSMELDGDHRTIVLRVNGVNRYELNKTEEHHD